MMLDAAVTVKLALLVPATTVTAPGRLARFEVPPSNTPVFAVGGCESVTVQVDTSDAKRFGGLQTSELTVIVTTICTVVDCDDPL